MRRRSYVSNSSRFIGYFRPIFDVTETLQIRQNLSVIFRPLMQWRRRFVKIYWPFFDQSLTSLRRRRFVKMYWLFSSNMRHCSDVIDSSKIIGNFWPNGDVAATSPIRRNLMVIFDKSLTSLRRCRFVKIYWLFSTSLRRCSDVTDLLKFISHFSTNLRHRRLVKVY